MLVFNWLKKEILEYRTLNIFGRHIVTLHVHTWFLEYTAVNCCAFGFLKQKEMLHRMTCFISSQNLFQCDNAHNLNPWSTWYSQWHYLSFILGGRKGCWRCANHPWTFSRQPFPGSPILNSSSRAPSTPELKAFSINPIVDACYNVKIRYIINNWGSNYIYWHIFGLD